MRLNLASGTTVSAAMLLNHLTKALLSAPKHYYFVECFLAISNCPFFDCAMYFLSPSASLIAYRSFRDHPSPVEHLCHIRFHFSETQTLECIIPLPFRVDSYFKSISRRVHNAIMRLLVRSYSLAFYKNAKKPYKEHQRSYGALFLKQPSTVQEFRFVSCIFLR